MSSPGPLDDPTLWPERLVCEVGAGAEVRAELDAEIQRLHEVDREPNAGYLRLWEMSRYVVVTGRSNRPEREVDLVACAHDGVEVVQRASGGGTVVLGPGCLCYALVLPIDERHRQLGVSVITAALMQRLARALSGPDQLLEVHGVSDLVHAGRKVSGNAQRWLRRSLLHHGTLLYDFDLERIGRYLQFPSRVPDYRGERSHNDFVANLPLSREEILTRLRAAWHA